MFWPGNLRQVLSKPSYNKRIEVNIKDAIPFQRPTAAFAKNDLFTNITHETGINDTFKQKDFIDFNIQKLLPHKFSQYAPGIAVGDVNGDGLDDFIVGGCPKTSPIVFIQKSNGTFSADTLLKSNVVSEKVSDDRGLLLFDADGDGDLDLYISAGGYAIKRAAENILTYYT